MPNAPALEYGQYYHLFNRGNNGEDLFVEPRNYPYFLQLFARFVEPVADTYAYCLLRNHFHLLVRIKTEQEQMQGQGQGQPQTFGVQNQTPKVEMSQTPKVGVSRIPKVLTKVLRPSQQFSNWFNAYAKAINRAYGRTGSLFEHPFERRAVDSEGYLAQLVVYVHRNPQKHGLVRDFRDWPYSSLPALLSSKPTHLKRDEVLAWFGGVEGFVSAHEREVAEEQLATLMVEDVH